MNLDEILGLPQYSLPSAKKAPALLSLLNELTAHHCNGCAEYRRVIDVFYGESGIARSLADIPFLPVSIFKERNLRSVPETEVFKTLLSSGTTGQQPSRIVLDRETSRRQVAALSSIMQHVLGPSRLPMLIVDTRSVLRDREAFSARAAGILGMMNFGRNHFYALNDDMELDGEGVTGFLKQHGSEPFLVFGFTFMVWQYLYLAAAEAGLDLSGAVLVHSGGWKKLQDQAVDNERFKAVLLEAFGIERVYNFYGMVEQVGSVFLEGEDGFLYPPNFADVLVRDPITLEVLPHGEEGVIQVVSALPYSYPGHSILTEDIGVVFGEDDSGIGRRGKRLAVRGRIPRAELRGCSDTHAATVSA